MTTGRTQRLTVGLTGGIGSGKTTVAHMLAGCGATIIDADAISRSLTEAGGAALMPIKQLFGEEVIGTDGALNRGAMREIVFAQPASRAKLEAIIHPLVQMHMSAAIQNQPMWSFLTSRYWLNRPAGASKLTLLWLWIAMWKHKSAVSCNAMAGPPAQLKQLSKAKPHVVIA